MSQERHVGPEWQHHCSQKAGMTQLASLGNNHNHLYAGAEHTRAQPGTGSATSRRLCCHMDCRLGLHFHRAGPLPKKPKEIYVARAASGLAGQRTSRYPLTAYACNGCSTVDGISRAAAQPANIGINTLFASMLQLASHARYKTIDALLGPARPALQQFARVKQPYGCITSSRTPCCLKAQGTRD